MAKTYNGVRFSTTTTGTGTTVAVGSAVTGYLTPNQSGVQNGDVVAYGIIDGSNFECGTWTYNSAGPSFTGRTPTISSAGANTAINLSGSAVCFITVRKEDHLMMTESQTANTVLAAPNGSSGVPTFRALVGADLPNPGASTLGGVESASAPSHEWMTGINTSGVPQFSQPNFTDLAGSIAAGQIPSSVITLAMLANETANTILGNNTGSPAAPIALTATQVTAMLNLFTSSLQGLVPLSGGGTTNYLRADGTWNAPPGTPSSPSGSIQYDNSGAFGAVPSWTDASSILALGNTTTAQQFLVYNTVDTISGPTNYERAVFGFDGSNHLLIGTQAGGTGSARSFQFVFGGTNVADYGHTRSSEWTFIPNDGVVNIQQPSGGVGGAAVQWYGADPAGMSQSDTNAGTFFASRGTVASPLAVGTGDFVGQFFGASWTGSGYQFDANFGFKVDGLSGNPGTCISFNVSNTSELCRFGSDFTVRLGNTNGNVPALWLYNTLSTEFPNPTNYERFTLGWQETSDVITLGVHAAGSGVQRGLQFTFAGTNKLDYGVTTAGTWTTGANFAFADAVNMPVGSTTGTQIATATTQKLGFYGATPIVQPAAPAASPVSTITTAATTATTGPGWTTTTQYNNLATTVADLVTECNSIRTALVNLGLI